MLHRTHAQGKDDKGLNEFCTSKTELIITAVAADIVHDSTRSRHKPGVPLGI